MVKEIIKEDKIYAYALKNAVEHEGKCQVGSVLSPLFAEGLKKENVKDIMPKINEIIKKVNSLSIEEQKKEYLRVEKLVGHREVRDINELPELPNASKGVIMRFRPAPSGPLHIGHIISNMANSLFVKKYGGKFYVIVDDTNPEETVKDSYENIKKDCDWIFGNVYEYLNSSDRLEVYYKYALELIKKGKAYVCTCDNEKFKELVKASKACPCRALSVEDNVKRWVKMLDKARGFKEGEAVLRFKSDLKNNNPAMRDFPLARINLKEHPKQGRKYRVWPLMNLSVTCDDIDYKMTHVIRGKDHKDNAERQKMIFKALGKEKQFPWTFFIGRMKFTDLLLSKRKIKAAIERGEFEGTDDIRLPTIASLRKRGYKPEAFAKFATQRGLSEVDKVISQKDIFDLLDRFNREV
jgi:glutamyl-tRNA synthetase